MKRKLILILILIFIILNKSYTQLALWGEKIPGANLENFAISETSGNIYIIGNTFKEKLVFNNNDYLSRKLDNGNLSFIAKYDNNLRVWSKSITPDTIKGFFSNLNLVTIHGLALDKNENLYVSGYFNSPKIIFNNGISLERRKDDRGVLFLAKYDKNGNCIWAKQLKIYEFVPEYEIIFSKIYIDNKSENIIVLSGDTKYIYNSMSKFDINGELKFQKNTAALALTFSNDSDEFYILRYNNTQNTITCLFGSEDENDKVTLKYFYIIKYDSLGQCIFAKQFTDDIQLSSHLRQYDMTIDKNDNLYIACNISLNFKYILFNNGLELYPRDENLASTSFIVKLDSQGQCVWAELFSASRKVNINKIVVDNNDDIYISGEFFFTEFELNNNVTIYAPEINKSIFKSVSTNSFIAKFNNNGQCIWAEPITGDYIDNNAIIGFDHEKNIYVAGQFLSSTLNFNNNVYLTGSGHRSIPYIYLVKYKDTKAIRYNPKPYPLYKIYTWAREIKNIDRYFDSLLQIGTDDTWSKISVSNNHILATKTDGSLWSWGLNSLSKLGLYFPDHTPVHHPQQVGSDLNWEKISAASNHSTAIKKDGSLWAWGGYSAEVGFSDFEYNQSTSCKPLRVVEGTKWIKISARNTINVGIQHDGSLWVWGRSNYKLFGDDTTIVSVHPIQIGTDKDWIDVHAGNGQHILALKNDGTLWVWGNNSNGGLGDNTEINRYLPTKIGTDNDWVKITANCCTSYALKRNGTLWGWGANIYNAMYLKEHFNTKEPFLMSNDSNWVDIYTSGTSSTLIAIKSDSTLWTWSSWACYLYYDSEVDDNTIPCRLGSDDMKFTDVVFYSDYSKKYNLFLALVLSSNYTDVSVSSNINNGVYIYPNPSNDFLNINYNDIIVSKVEIYDYLGQLKYQYTYNIENINISNLTHGVYYIKIYTISGEIIINKFVKLL